MADKETLTVEWLPAYKKYRVWNTWNEDWFDTWQDFTNAVYENDLLGHYNFVSYNKTTQQKLLKLGGSNG